MPDQTVAPEGFRDRVQRAIEDDIAAGRLKPGEKLDERGLAIKYGISRTPIREALHRLASIGLIETRARQGAYVARISLSEQMALFEYNCELEALSAQIAARRMTEQEREALLAIASEGHRIAEAGSVEEYSAHNLSFHTAIGQGSHNSYIQAESASIRIKALPYRRTTMSLPDRMHESAREHDAIAKVIAKGDSTEAFALMHQHTDIQRPEYRDFLYMLLQVSASD